MNEPTGAANGQLTTLAKLREAKAAREDARAKEAEARELLSLQLEERYEAELGPRGSMFEIVATLEGPIVVRLGEAVLFKKFKAAYAGDKEPTLEDQHSYVYPCVVYPDKAKFLEIIERRPALLGVCANAAATLHLAKEVDARGK